VKGGARYGAAPIPIVKLLLLVPLNNRAIFTNIVTAFLPLPSPPHLGLIGPISLFSLVKNHAAPN